MRVILAGGGTAGHINPAIAIARYIASQEKNSQFLFVGTSAGMETELVPKAGFEIKYIKVEGFARKLTPSNIAAVIKAGTAVLASRRIIKDFKPDIVIGTGGYVSGPVLFAASAMKIPTLIHEQNAFAGMTSKLLCSRVDVTCISFEQSRKAFAKAKKIVCTGNPLRAELFSVSKRQAREKLKLDSRPFIVCFGGSLGAQTINDSVIHLLEKFPRPKAYQLLFATGTGSYDGVLRELEARRLKTGDNVKIVPYIFNMDEVIPAADLLICRSGAITLSEINALGKAAILIPSPNVTDNHQYHNAAALKGCNAAELITEEQLAADKNTLNSMLAYLLEHKEIIAKMEDSSKKMGITDGAARIYAEVCGIIK